MIIVEQGQTIFDIAVQHCGNAIAVFDIARINGFSVTDPIDPGTSLVMPDKVDVGLSTFFKENKYIPATAQADNSQVEPEGIDYWAVLVDFIIS